MSFYVQFANVQRKSMRVSVDQDYAIRTKLRWYDLLDHIICLSVPHLLYRAMQGCSCGSPQGPGAGYAEIDASIILVAPSIDRFLLRDPYRYFFLSQF